MADAPEQKKSKLKLLILGLVLLIVIAGGGVAAWKFLAPPADAPTADAGSSRKLVSVAVPGFLVNLADPLGRRFIKLTIELEVSSSKIASEVENQMPRIRDAVNLLLSSKSYSDLASYESKILLRNEIMERANQALGGVKVMRVNFLELVIQ